MQKYKETQKKWLLKLLFISQTPHVSFILPIFVHQMKSRLQRTYPLTKNKQQKNDYAIRQYRNYSYL